MYSLITVLLIVLVVSRVQPWLCSTYNLVCISAPSTLPGGDSPFAAEDFHNNGHNWTIGSLDNGNLQADVSNHQYTLTIGSVQNTYFPHPQLTASLPQNFTLTIKIAQVSGDTHKLFGIAFRLQGTDQLVSSYVFAINRAGQLARAKELAADCDLFLVIGSSLKVMPAAMLPRLALKYIAPLIIINLQPTSLDSLADVVIAEKAGLVLPQLVEML